MVVEMKIDDSIYYAHRQQDGYKNKHYHIEHISGPEQPISLIAVKLDRRAEFFGYRWCHCAPVGMEGIRIHTD